MSFEPSDAMVEAAAKKLFGADPANYFVSRARLALRAAFAAAVQAGEAREARSWSCEDVWRAETESDDFPAYKSVPAIILRKPQEREK